jgi:alkylated DNA repair dioxygenase AlkB
MPAAQPALFAPSAPDGPEGFRYQPDLISSEEERLLSGQIAELEFHPFDFHGHLANRHVAWFGWRYDYGGRRLGPAEPIPDFLLPLRRLVGAFTGHPPEAFEQVLINQYRPGAGIGWHRDKAHFGEVVGVSLLATCTFRFRDKVAEGKWRRMSLTVEPRSAYLLSGPARSVWEHSIPPQEALRYSVTFRTLAPR